jgi:tetratricopeptide (TPR) repeat protein
VLSPTVPLAELGRALDLPVRRADAATRHRTLRTAISWSHDRLSAGEQRLLARMSVLRGSGDLDAVRTVAGDDLDAPVVDVLMDLVDRHLVEQVAPVVGRPRFRLLETVRQFAAERLADAGETEATELRAAEWFAEWAVGLAAHGEGPDAGRWLALAGADADNLRAAMDLFERTGRTEELLQLVVDALALWFELGYEVEGERRLERALAAAPKTAGARAVGLVYLSWFVSVRFPDRAGGLVQEAIRLATEQGDDAVLALALIHGGDGALVTDPDAMREDTARGVALAERLRGRPVRYGMAAPDAIIAEAADNLSAYHVYRDVREAVRWQQRAVEIHEQSGDRRQLARHLSIITWMLLLAGDVEGAAGRAARARTLVTAPGTARWEDHVALAQALVLLFSGQRHAAEIALRALISDCLAAGRLLHVHWGCAHLTDLLLWQDRIGDAEAVLGTVDRLVADTDDPEHITRLRVRRTRLLRMKGQHDDAVAMLEEAEAGIAPDQLTLEHMIWLVESALLADTEHDRCALVARLEALSAKTGVRVPPWERRWLAAATREGVR